MSARAVLADAVLLLHLAVVLFNIGGLIVVLATHARGWAIARHRAFRLWHLGIVWFVAVEAALGYSCPLTVLEDALRASSPDPGGFVQRWVSRILFWDLPAWVFAVAYAAFAGTVTAAYVALPPRARSHY